MAHTTEKEILDRLKSSLRECVADADALARGERGPIYRRFRENLLLVWGATRQISGWREDTRWLRFGVQVHECRERCRRWIVDKHGPEMFKKLADVLRAAEKEATDLETRRTGKVGMILPKPLPSEPVTQGRSILVPAGYQDVRNKALTTSCLNGPKVLH